MTDVRGEPPAKRRRRRKRKKQDNKGEDIESSDPSSTVLKPANSSSGPLTLDEPLTIPSALLGRYDNDRHRLYKFFSTVVGIFSLFITL